MSAYYADARKYFLNTKNPVIDSKPDKKAGQFVGISGSVFGVAIKAPKDWTPFCEALFHKRKANGIVLGDWSGAWNGDLGFINRLPACKHLTIEYGDQIDLSPLGGNRHLEGLQLSGSKRPSELDLASLPNLRRCQMPVYPELMSVLECRNLISLALIGGKHEDTLVLDSLATLEEFICARVGKLKGVVFNPRVRLRTLELSHMKLFESAGPLPSIVNELRDVTLNQVPRMKIDWLSQAKKAECIALRIGEIPSIKFLKGLKRLQVLDLFGSKVKDRDLSFRDSLKGELDPGYWGT